jgi:hypothetical protein
MLDRMDWWQIYLMARDAKSAAEKILGSSAIRDVQPLRDHIAQLDHIMQVADAEYAKLNT